MLSGALVLGILLWSAGLFAASPLHAQHRQTGAGQGIIPVAASITLAMPASDSACHHGAPNSGPGHQGPSHPGPDRAAPPCCVGLACLAMPVGLEAEAVSMPPPGQAPGRPGHGTLLEGEGVPPDLPPPRRV